MPNPLPPAFFPVSETTRMTRTAKTTSTVPRTPTVMAVLRLGAFFAVARRGADPPALARLAADASAFGR